MDKNYFEKFIEEERRVFEEIHEIDQFQKKNNEYDCRYITKSFADRKAFYQIVDETPRKYILKWVLGEDPYPEWGIEVKLFKKDVEKIIKGRDYFENIISLRKNIKE
jgi:hypothetical protein